MSENFRPLFGLETPQGSESFKDEIHKLLEEKRSLEEELRRLEEKLRSMEEENHTLLEEVKSLREELVEKSSRIEELVSELVDARLKKSIAERLTLRIQEELKKTREELKEDFLRLSREIIKEFLMTDVIPKEDIVTKILGEVFESSLDLKGSVKVFLNPVDMEKVFDFIANIREKLSDKVDIEVLGDEKLQPGELRIETPKFVIERKHSEIIEEVMKEVLRRVPKGS